MSSDLRRSAMSARRAPAAAAASSKAKTPPKSSIWFVRRLERSTACVRWLSNSYSVASISAKAARRASTVRRTSRSKGINLARSNAPDSRKSISACSELKASCSKGLSRSRRCCCSGLSAVKRRSDAMEVSMLPAARTKDSRELASEVIAKLCADASARLTSRRISESS